MSELPIPIHLQRWPGLFEWRDGVVVEAPVEDANVARAYPRFSDKGPLISGTRLTLMTRRHRYRAGEEVRIVHVVEVIEPGRHLYVMGPKLAYAEYVDDVLMTPPPPDDMWEPGTYNGLILPTPAVDYNYEITSYRFDDLGPHRIQWRAGNLRSNVLSIEVVP